MAQTTETFRADASQFFATLKEMKLTTAATFSTISSAINIARGMASGLSNAISTIAVPLKLAAEFEDATVKLSTFVGGIDNATAIARDLRDHAANSSSSFEDLASAARIVAAAFNTTAAITSWTKRLDDLSVATGIAATDLAKLLTTVNTTGKIEGEALNKLVKQGGVDFYQRMADAAGIAKNEVAQFAQQGKISIEQFNAALIETTKSVEGISAALSNTTAGRIGTFSDNIKNSIAEAADEINKHGIGPAFQYLNDKMFNSPEQKIENSHSALNSAFVSFREASNSASASELAVILQEYNKARESLLTNISEIDAETGTGEPMQNLVGTAKSAIDAYDEFIKKNIEIVQSSAESRDSIKAHASALDALTAAQKKLNEATTAATTAKLSPQEKLDALARANGSANYTAMEAELRQLRGNTSKTTSQIQRETLLTATMEQAIPLRDARDALEQKALNESLAAKRRITEQRIKTAATLNNTPENRQALEKIEVRRMYEERFDDYIAAGYKPADADFFADKSVSAQRAAAKKQEQESFRERTNSTLKGTFIESSNSGIGGGKGMLLNGFSPLVQENQKQTNILQQILTATSARTVAVAG